MYALLASSLNKKIKNVPLSSLGVDSLKRMEILSLIEENYGIESNESDTGKTTTPKDLEKLIRERKKVYYYDFSLPKLRFIGRVFNFLASKISCKIE